MYVENTMLLEYQQDRTTFPVASLSSVSGSYIYLTILHILLFGVACQEGKIEKTESISTHKTVAKSLIPGT